MGRSCRVHDINSVTSLVSCHDTSQCRASNVKIAASAGLVKEIVFAAV